MTPSNQGLWLMCLTLVSPIFTWLDETQPRNRYNIDDDLGAVSFRGNVSHSEHMKIVKIFSNSLLVGGRNVVYNLSLFDLSENERLIWDPPNDGVQLCLMKGKSVDVCQNYIRVLEMMEDGNLLICGTNAYKPLCRQYGYEPDEGYVKKSEKTGVGLCPYDPTHNSTAYYKDRGLYVGTVADFGGTDPLIYREPLRTEQSDPKHLNDPDFVNSFDYHNSIFFFFREPAIEYINCGKRVYSRVARVCKSDRGGLHNYRSRFTSYLKSRLNCSLPGDYPFYFDEIQSTSGVMSVEYGGRMEDVVFAVFTTPQNSLPGSAICAFKTRDILDTFNGNFKEQKTMNSNWLPVLKSKVPDPRPGICVDDSRTLKDDTLNFAKSHVLMDESVPALYNRPLFIRTSLRTKLTSVVVDGQRVTADGTKYDVIFTGTDNGSVLKLVYSTKSSEPEAIIVEEISVFPPGYPVTNLQLTPSVGFHESKLLVSSQEQVVIVTLSRCHKYKTCSLCVGAGDPYCAWNVVTRVCQLLTENDMLPDQHTFLQAVGNEQENMCRPQGDVTNAALMNPEREIIIRDKVNVARNVTTAPPKDNRAEYRLASRYSYTAQTLTIALCTSCLVALVVGFLSGYLYSRHCRTDMGYSQCATTHLDHKYLTPNRNHYQNKIINQSNDTAFLSPHAPGHVQIKPMNNLQLANTQGSAQDNDTLRKIKLTYL